MDTLELKPDRHYDRVHAWLRKNYGKANNCQGLNCTTKSKSYHWAKLHGFEYDYNRTHFIMLCQSCHKKYDMTNETRLKMSKSKIGENHNGSKLTAEQVIEIRSYKNIKYGDKRAFAEYYGVSESLIAKIINRQAWTHLN